MTVLVWTVPIPEERQRLSSAATSA